MNIEKLVDTYMTDLPGYNIIGYFEIGIPVYKRNLLCIMINKKALPVVEEFVLRFFNLGLDRAQIVSILSLDNELVEEAWWNLIHKDLISRKNEEITEFGFKYLKECSIENYEKVMVKVGIDGLLGTVQKDSPLMYPKTMRDNGIHALNTLIEKPNVKNISLEQVRLVINKSGDEDIQDGILLDISDVQGTNTQYKKLGVLVYSDGFGNVRLNVYDGAHKKEKYEDAVMKLVEKGCILYKCNYGGYFDNPDIILEQLGDVTSNSILTPAVIRDKNNQLIKDAKKDLLISIPMIDMCKFPEHWIDDIKRKIDMKINVTLIFSGREFSNSTQKRQINKLLSLKKKSNTLRIVNLPFYLNKFVISDNLSGVVSEYIKTEVSLSNNNIFIFERGYELSCDDIRIIQNNERINRASNEINMLSKITMDKQMINKLLFEITQLINEFDEVLKQYNNVGCLGEEPIPDAQKLIDSPVANNEDAFKIFINSLNQSFVESFETIWKIKGLSSAKNKYFFNGFKELFPELQRVLHKVKLYRHSLHHLGLEERFKPTYYEFLDEDLNGSLPTFVEKGYLILQKIIIVSLSSELRRIIIEHKAGRTTK
jgi:hypothetical protein